MSEDWFSETSYLRLRSRAWLPRHRGLWERHWGLSWHPALVVGRIDWRLLDSWNSRWAQACSFVYRRISRKCHRETVHRCSEVTLWQQGLSQDYLMSSSKTEEKKERPSARCKRLFKSDASSETLLYYASHEALLTHILILASLEQIYHKPTLEDPLKICSFT